MCVCIREEGRQAIRRVRKSAGPCETRRRRRNERTEVEKAQEDVNVYRTQRRVRVGGSTAVLRPDRAEKRACPDCSRRTTVSAGMRMSCDQTRRYARHREGNERGVLLFPFLADL